MDMIENPLLKCAGRNMTRFPDLQIEVVVVQDENKLHVPIFSPFKPMNNRFAWNQWIKLPLKYSVS